MGETPTNEAEGPFGTVLPIVLDHVVIASSDLQASGEFYRRVFGASVEAPMANFHQYRIGSTMLNVHGPGLVEMAPPDLLAARPVAPGGSDLCFAWRGSLEALLRHLESCNVEVTTGPVEREGAMGQGTSVYFRDPDGSLLEFIIYPGMT